MERPSEIRAVCQEGKTSDPRWYVVHRRVSIYLTWLLLHTKLTPNHISLLMMPIGAAGALLLASSDLVQNGIGFGLLYLMFLLDKADGEVARYRKAQSAQGIMLDRLHHLLVEPAIVFAAAYRDHTAGGGSGILVAALVTIVLGNIIEEQQHMSPYIFFKHLTTVRRVPSRRSRPSATLALLAKLLRPLKAFRLFIVVLQSLAIVYLAEWTFGWPAVRAYVYAATAALAVYLAFQTIYYFHTKLEDEFVELEEYASGHAVEDRSAVEDRDIKERTPQHPQPREFDSVRPGTVSGAIRL